MADNNNPASLNDPFFQRLTRLFRSGPAIQRRIKGIDPKNYFGSQLIRGNYGYRAAAPFGFGRENSPFGTLGAYGIIDRSSRYAEYSEMDMSTPEISTALNLYAEESVGGDDRGRCFHIYSDNEQIKNALDELFYDVLNVEHNLKPWVRNLVKYGCFFLFLEVLPDIGIINVFPIPVNEIEREDGFDPADPYATRFKWITRGNKYLENWQVAHFRLLSNDLFMPYGTSVLESSRRTWRQLCHAPDTNVLLTTGKTKYIKDIKKDDEVYSFDFNVGKLVKTKVKAVSEMGVQDLVRVNTVHRSIDVTPNHGLLVYSNIENKFLYKKASEISFVSKNKNRDMLVLPNVSNDFTDTNVYKHIITDSKYYVHLLQVPQIKSEGVIAKIRNSEVKTSIKNTHTFLKGQRKIHVSDYRKLLKVFPELKECKTELYWFRSSKKSKVYYDISTNNVCYDVTNDFVKFFGFMLGDGWLSHSGNNGFGFACGVYPEQNQYYIDMATSLCGTECEKIYRGNDLNQVGFNTSDFNNILRQLGFITGFAKKNIPDWIFKLSKEDRLSFIRGIIDADGSSDNGSIQLSNKQLSHDLHQMFYISGVPCSKTVKVINIPVAKFVNNGKEYISNRNTIYRINYNLKQICDKDYRLEYVTSVDPIKEDMTYDLQVASDLHNFVANGVITHNTLLEDAMLTYRVVRSPERRVFYIDTGNIPPNDVDSYMEAVKSTMKSNGNMDRKTGREDLRYNSQSVLDDFYIPVRGKESGTRIETLAGGQHVSAVEDIEYMQKKLFAGLGVPKPYLNFNENLSAKAALAQLDIRFSRTISSIQKIMVAELNKLAMIHLFVKGFDGPDLVNFELKLSNPSSVALQQRLELWSAKFDTAGTAKETKLVDEEWIQRNILELTPGEIGKIEKGLRKDKVREKELDDLELTPVDPKEAPKTTDIFDASNYDPPAPVVPKSPMINTDFGDNPNRFIKRQDLIIGDEYKSSSEYYKINDLEDKKAPVKATPFLSRNSKNRTRRVGQGGISNLAMPDMNAMVSSKNKYTRDVFGSKTESMDFKRMVMEDIENEEDITLNIEPKFSNEMKSVFNRIREHLATQPNAQKNNLLTEKLEHIRLENHEIDIELDASLDEDNNDPSSRLLKEVTDFGELDEENKKEDIVDIKSLKELYKDSDED